ncbi:unnamed protein product [Paramecium octaurelia]|uniref:Uncharacterized protein n=1 Tax=Paramecium octaurelia TaxID=43137 RepID=A0A8S1XWE3_PAROT|nr:unnamed protein product [Paramecium octaurelia]
MDNEERKVGEKILADDISEKGNDMNPQKKLYTLFHKGPKSLSKEGDQYSSPTRNSEGFMATEQYNKEQEEQETQNKIYQSKSKSQLVPKGQSQEPEIARQTQSQIKFR